MDGGDCEIQVIGGKFPLRWLEAERQTAGDLQQGDAGRWSVVSSQ